MANLNMIKALEAHGVEVKTGKNKVDTYSSLTGMLAAIEAEASLPFKVDYNKAKAKESLTDDSSDHIKFCGGSYKRLVSDLKGFVDMGPFQEERDRLVNSGLLSKLATASQEMTPKRKRRMSEHDGEWDHDRQWEITPFASTFKTLQPERVIEIICNFSISGWANSKDVDAYGVLVWSIADIIESSGIRTKIVYHQPGAKVDRDKLEMHNYITLKQPEEYLPPSQLAAAFTSNFYRRASFAMISIACDAYGVEVSSGLGSPMPSPTIQFSDGKLEISADAKAGMTDEISKAVLAAIEWKG